MSRITGRASLGGLALRDINRTSTHSYSRNDSSSSPTKSKRRVSFGGNSHTGSSLHDFDNGGGGGTTTTTNLNDISFSTTTSSSTTAMEPRKDRRTMLEEWRAKIRAKEANSGNSILLSGSASQQQPQMQQQHQEQEKENIMSSSNTTTPIIETPALTLPLPPSTNIQGTTAVERFRLRRLQRERMALSNSTSASNEEPLQSHSSHHSIMMPPLPPSDKFKTSTSCSTTVAATVSTTATGSSSSSGLESYSTSTSVICFDDDVAPSSSSRIGRVGSTPLTNRRMTLSGGARRRVGKGRKSMLPTSSSNTSSLDYNDTEIVPTETVTATNTTEQIVYQSKDCKDTEEEINEPGLRSKLIQMEKRIQQLEEEKMSISMSKAPLEARLRQKEDQWSKEQSKYEQEISSLMNSSKETSDKIKSLEMELEALQEDNRKLRFEARKQEHINTTEGEGCSNDIWSRQLQNDRDVLEFKDKLHAAEEEIKALRLEKVSIQSEVNATNLELSALIREFDDLQFEYEELLSKKDSNAEAEIQLEELKKEHTAATAQLNATSGELASLKSQSKFDMKMKEKEWQDERDKLMFDISVLKSRAGTNLDENSSDSDVEDEAVLRARIEERDRRISQLEAEVLKGEQIRREMHNRIQELRGNIRVFVRTRPFLPGDNGETVSSIDVLPDGESLSIEGHSKMHDFKFDKVFPPSSGQELVFDEVSEFVQSALDGYHVCLFSYGQTGSGKTHTMQGSGNGAMRGIIPRAVEQILSQANRMKEQKWTFNVSASFLEIYNEELKDLLVDMNGRNSEKTDKLKLAIKREKNGKSYVSNLTKVDIETDDFEAGMKGLKEVMAAAAKTRSVACTKMNSVSSRSHSVFMLHLSGTNEESGTYVKGALNLCDLAGSERLDRSGAGSDAQRLKETQSINKSLSCLGDVFTALSNRSSHVPYRNSKLTYLLQDCLSGDGKALMFVNLSPTQASSNESLCSLRFAQRVNQVELGKATKHVQYRSCR